jgi:hypothetical protein
MKMNKSNNDHNNKNLMNKLLMIELTCNGTQGGPQAVDVVRLGCAWPSRVPPLCVVCQHKQARGRVTGTKAKEGCRAI